MIGAMVARCPACGASRVDEVLHWPDIPANSALFLETPEEARACPRGSFRLAVCLVCGFLFNADFDPRLPEYSERNLESQLWSSEFRHFADDLARGWIERYDLRGAHVLEIGSGLTAGFLRGFCDLSGGTAVGFDPVSRFEGTETIRLVKDLFDDRWLDEHADAVICRHTLEHIPGVAGFLGTVRRWGDRHRDSVFLFELPDTERILKENAFWDLYYEHCSYFTAGTLTATFERHGFDVLRCEHAFGGQYLVLEARLASAQAAPLDVDADTVVGLAYSFARDLETTSAAYRRRFEELAAEGPVLLWQAGAKATSLISVLGIGDLVSALVDLNPAKRGRFTVGSGHPVVAPEDVRELSPRHIVLMNPLYLREVQAILDQSAIDACLHSADALATGA